MIFGKCYSIKVCFFFFSYQTHVANHFLISNRSLNPEWIPLLSTMEPKMQVLLTSHQLLCEKCKISPSGGLTVSKRDAQMTILKEICYADATLSGFQDLIVSYMSDHQVCWWVSNFSYFTLAASLVFWMSYITRIPLSIKTPQQSLRCAKRCIVHNAVPRTL